MVRYIGLGEGRGLCTESMQLFGTRSIGIWCRIVIERRPLVLGLLDSCWEM